jgi:hypothetical protein
MVLDCVGNIVFDWIVFSQARYVTVVGGLSCGTTVADQRHHCFSTLFLI